jgi:mannose-6-phosphate isomerase-like protein (cupin superfamily)
MRAMSSEPEVPRGIIKGDGYAVTTLHDLGPGPGFLKVRRELDVDEFGVNAIVLPEGFESGFHYHERQQELYFVHRGTLEIEFGDGRLFLLPEGGMARVDAATHRKLRNAGKGDVVYVAVGAEGGYVGRDAHVPEGDQRVRRG